MCFYCFKLMMNVTITMTDVVSCVPIHIGNYVCSCQVGYSLATDNKACNGIYSII